MGKAKRLGSSSAAASERLPGHLATGGTFAELTRAVLSGETGREELADWERELLALLSRASAKKDQKTVTRSLDDAALLLKKQGTRTPEESSQDEKVKHPVVEAVAKALGKAVMEEGDTPIGAARALGLLGLAEASLAFYKKAAQTCLQDLVVPWLAARAFSNHPLVSQTAVETFERAVSTPLLRMKLLRSFRKRFFQIVRDAPPRAIEIHITPLLVALQNGALSDDDSTELSELLGPHLQKPPCKPAILHFTARLILALPHSMCQDSILRAATGSIASVSPEAWELALAAISSGLTPPGSSAREELSSKIAYSLKKGKAFYPALYPILKAWDTDSETDKIKNALRVRVLRVDEGISEEEREAAVEIIEFYSTRDDKNARWAAEFATDFLIEELRRGQILVGRTQLLERKLKTALKIFKSHEVASKLASTLSQNAKANEYRAHHRFLQSIEKKGFSGLRQIWSKAILEDLAQNIDLEKLPDPAVDFVIYIARSIPDSLSPQLQSTISASALNLFLSSGRRREALLLGSLTEIRRENLAGLHSHANLLSSEQIATLSLCLPPGTLHEEVYGTRILTLKNSAPSSDQIDELIRATWCENGALAVSENVREELFVDNVLNMPGPMLSFIQTQEVSVRDGSHTEFVLRCLASEELNEDISHALVCAIADCAALKPARVALILAENGPKSFSRLSGQTLAEIAAQDTDWLLQAIANLIVIRGLDIDEFVLGTALSSYQHWKEFERKEVNLEILVDLLLYLKNPKKFLYSIRHENDADSLNNAYAIIAKRITSKSIELANAEAALWACVADRYISAEGLLRMFTETASEDSTSSRLCGIALEAGNLNLQSKTTVDHVRRHLTSMENSNTAQVSANCRAATWPALWNYGHQVEEELRRSATRCMARLEQCLSNDDPAVFEVGDTLMLGILLPAVKNCPLGDQEYTRLVTLATRLLEFASTHKYPAAIPSLTLAVQLLEIDRSSKPSGLKERMRSLAAETAPYMLSTLLCSVLSGPSKTPWQSEAAKLLLNNPDMLQAVRLSITENEVRWQAIEQAAQNSKTDIMMTELLLNYAIATGVPLDFQAASDDGNDELDRDKVLGWLPKKLFGLLDRGTGSDCEFEVRLVSWIYLLELAKQSRVIVEDSSSSKRRHEFRKTVLRLLRLHPSLLGNALSDFFGFASSKGSREDNRQNLCLRALTLLLEVVPGLARIWFSEDLNRSQCLNVKAFVRKNLTARLVETEIRQLKQLSTSEGKLSDLKASADQDDEDDGEVGELKIRASIVSREVKASYILSEVSIEITLRLPDCHPLEPIVVETGQRMGMSEKMWRKTILGITKLVTLQGEGNLAQAVELWRKNLDKTFAGVEDCPICYSVLHLSTGALPKLSCGTCSSKFHSACLCKWFATSNTSTCPMCRSAF